MPVRAHVRKVALAALGVLALALLAWRFSPRPGDIAGALAGADVGMLVLAVAVNAAGIVARAEAWRRLRRRERGLGLGLLARVARQRDAARARRRGRARGPRVPPPRRR